MEICCVDGCQESIDSENILFHKFPRNAALKRKWSESVPLKKGSCDPPTICSNHFLDTDYKHVRGKRILNYNVVPSIFNCDDKEVNNIKDVVNNRLSGNNGNANDLLEKKEKNHSELNFSEAIAEADANNAKDETKEPLEKKSKLKDDLNKENIISTEKEHNGCKEKETEDKIGDKTIVLDKMNQDLEECISSNKIVNTNDICRPKGNMCTKDMEFDQKVDLEDDIPSFIIQDNNSNIRCFEVVIPGDDDNLSTFSGLDIEGIDIENLEVSIDPTLLLMDEPIIEDEIEISDSDGEKGGRRKSKREPEATVSLLTSSDEDDVILQEPKIDTVEVSDETDEEDIPLLRLVAQKDSLEESIKNHIISNFMKKVFEYFCTICRYSTTSKINYAKHIKSHAGELVICPFCSHKSKHMKGFKRHIESHIREKQFKCHICPYTATHQMSLVFHLKNHDTTYKCKKCPYETAVKDNLARHVKVHGRTNICDTCGYRTRSVKELKGHMKGHEKV